MMEPALDQLQKDLPGKIKVVRVNVDENQNLASQYGIMSIPALFLFKNGQVIRQWIGVQNGESLKEEISQFLSF